MKSFSNFLLEKKPLDITNDPKGGEKFLRNIRRKSAQNQSAQNRELSPNTKASIEADARRENLGGYDDGKPTSVRGGKGSSNAKSYNDHIKQQRIEATKERLKNTLNKGESRADKYKTNKPPTGKQVQQFAKDITGKAADDKSGVGGTKGVGQTKSLKGQTLTGGKFKGATPIDKRSASELRKFAKDSSATENPFSGKTDKRTLKTSARRVTQKWEDTKKAASKRNEKIRTQGKQLLTDIQKTNKKSAQITQRMDKAVSTSKKPGTLSYKTDKLINTIRSKGTKTVKQSEVSKKIAQSTKQYNINRTTGQTSLFNFPEKPSKDVTQGFRASSTSPQGTPTPRSQRVSPGQGVLDFSKKPKLEVVPDSKVTGSKFGGQQWQGPKIPPTPSTPPKSKFTSNTTGKLGDTAWRDNTKKAFKPAKTFKQFASKLPKPVRSAGKLLKNTGGKLVGPAFAVADGIGNYKGYKKQGYNTSGALARSGAKTGAYWGGWAAGAKGGAALGASIGSVVPGVGTAIGGAVGAALGGFAGGHLAGKTADWAIKGYDEVFGKQKLKDIKAKNVAKMNAKALKANPYKNAQPKISKNKIATDKGNFSTITLRKGKDGNYIMPKGFKEVGKASRVTKLATT